MKFRLAALAALALCSTATHAALTNGGFENPVFTANNWYPVASIPGWTATPSNANIEVWAQPYLNVAAYEGNQFVELNSNLASTIYQDISSVAGQSVGYTFAHRGRAGTDTMSFTATDLGADGIFGTSDDVVLVTRTVSDGNSGWGFYSDRGIITSGNTIRLSFTAVNPTGSVGNFLDAVRFDAGVPEPTALALVGLGLAGLGLSRRRKQQA